MFLAVWYVTRLSLKQVLSCTLTARSVRRTLITITVIYNVPGAVRNGFQAGAVRNGFEAGKIHYEGHWKGWALEIVTFLGPEMATSEASTIWAQKSHAFTPCELNEALWCECSNVELNCN